ncbi:MAG: hypothetical protein ABIV06_02055 [Thermoanaerobaculia bacterium]
MRNSYRPYATWSPAIVRVGLSCLLLLSIGGGAAAAPPQDRLWIDLDRPVDAARKVDPLGRYVVAIEDREGYGRLELWSVPADDRAPIRLAGGPAEGEIQAFRLSPDGERVAFVAGPSFGAQQLFVVPISGGVARRLDDDRLPGAAIARFAFRDDSAAVAWDTEESVPTDTGSPPNVVLLTTIFNNNFESGDSSEWSDTTSNVCPAPTGGPTNHANAVPPGSVWTANGSPHIFTGNVQVPVGVTLTIAPCAEVRIPANMYLEVNGTLNALGTPLARIRVHRHAGAAFQSIWVRSSGFGDLAFLDLDGGGSSSLNAALTLEGTGAGQPRAKLDHVKITGSAGYGVYLASKAEFAAGSRDLVISGAGATSATAPFPMRLSLNAVGSVPTGTYTGNASDFLQVEGGTVTSDATFHDRGVPYQIGSAGATFGVLEVDGGASLATLTIEAGVEMRFYSLGSNVGGLFVGPSSPSATGRLIAAGTATEPILFTATGVAPPAGTWEGVTFSGGMAAGNLLDHVQIEAAGAHGGDSLFGCPPINQAETRGALKLFTEPAASFLTNSTVSNSSLHGVFRAWNGGLVDFVPTNTFLNIAGCNQVLPKSPTGTCPVNPGCS